LQTLTAIVSFTSTVIMKIDSTFNWKLSKELNFKKKVSGTKLKKKNFPFMLLSNTKNPHCYAQNCDCSIRVYLSFAICFSFEANSDVFKIY